MTGHEQLQVLSKPSTEQRLTDLSQWFRDANAEPRSRSELVRFILWHVKVSVQSVSRHRLLEMWSEFERADVGRTFNVTPYLDVRAQANFTDSRNRIGHLTLGTVPKSTLFRFLVWLEHRTLFRATPEQRRAHMQAYQESKDDGGR